MTHENTSAEVALLRARMNGGIAHGTHEEKPLGFFGRAWFRFATICFCVSFGIVYAVYVAMGETRQDKINRRHGEGEA